MKRLFRFGVLGGPAAIWILCLSGFVAAQEISVVDLGVKATESKAVGINNRGHVVGWSWLTDPYSASLTATRAFLVNPKDTDGDGDADLWFEDLAGDGINDLLINLTPGEKHCVPIKINEKGQVLIKKTDSSTIPTSYSYYLITPLASDGGSQPDTWFQEDISGHNALMVPIPPIGGARLEAFGLNNLGQVVGGSTTEDGAVHVFLWSALTGTLDLGTIASGYEGYGMDINDSGQVAGFGMILFTAYKPFRLTPLDLVPDGKPDCWFQDSQSDGVNDLMDELAGLGDGFDQAWAVNEAGQVAGAGCDVDDVAHPLLWSGPETPLDLGSVGGYCSEAIAINDHGQVIGYGDENVDPYDWRPFFWSGNCGFVVLGKTEWGNTYAWDLNDLGQVVCSDEILLLPFRMDEAKASKFNRGFLWSEQLGRIDLVGLEEVADMCWPVAINDSGIIVGASASISQEKWKTAVIWIVANTETGSDVPVTPVDPGTGESPVTLVFDEVTEPGDTTLTVLPTGTQHPNGFKLGNPPQYYVIETTATYSGPITICINYAGVEFGNDNNVELYHNASGHWEKITSAVYPETQTVCGVVASLSEFALFEFDVTADGLQSPLAGLVQIGQEVPLPDVAFKLGRTLPLKLRLFAGDMLLTNADVAPPKIVSLARSGEAIALDTLDLDAGEANDSGTLFRFEDGLWVYNLSTKGLLKGTYTITLELPDGDHVCTGFVLR